MKYYYMLLLGASFGILFCGLSHDLILSFHKVMRDASSPEKIVSSLDELGALLESVDIQKTQEERDQKLRSMLIQYYNHRYALFEMRHCPPAALAGERQELLQEQIAEGKTVRSLENEITHFIRSRYSSQSRSELRD